MDEQSVCSLQEADAGVLVADLCRKPGMSSATFYAWTSKHGGLEPFEARRLRGLEEEDELSNETLFTSLAHAREAVAAWADDDNAERPHSALGYAAPADDGHHTRRSRAEPTDLNDSGFADAGEMWFTMQSVQEASVHGKAMVH